MMLFTVLGLAGFGRRTGTEIVPYLVVYENLLEGTKEVVERRHEYMR